jgi:DNA (cytosine-5)-methyltransferase 1
LWAAILLFCVGCYTTLGSLFDGIGGFPLAGVKVGIRPVWASEIEAMPTSITKRHFPDMRHLGDITKINGADIEPVDIITFGSPCQDLSIAGRRAGLGGGRSGLFSEAVRVIKEMRSATNETYPARIVWENVPGAFSSQRGRDFLTVIEEISKIADAGISIPRPSSRDGWLSAGAVVGDCWSLAWRVLDAQYWGVPHRRSRIFLVADFGGRSAGEILFKPESGTGCNEEGGTSREGVAGNGEKGVEQYVVNGGYSSDRIQVNPKVSVTLKGQGGGGGAKTGLYYLPTYCIVGNAIDRSDKSGGNGKGVCEDVSYTLNATDRHAVVVLNDQGGNSISIEAPDISPCLRSECHGNLPIVAEFTNYQETVGCLVARDYKGVSNQYVEEDKCICDSGGVRRLTPTECERLQGFPDGWTEYGHDGKRISDNQRYKALGNSVAIPCVVFILSRMTQENRE